MAKARFDIKDIDAAAALSSRIEHIGEEVAQLCTTAKTKASEAMELDGTMDNNVQVANYLNEAAGLIEGTIEPIQQAGKCLAGIVAMAADFKEQSTRGTLF